MGTHSNQPWLILKSEISIGLMMWITAKKNLYASIYICAFKPGGVPNEVHNAIQAVLFPKDSKSKNMIQKEFKITLENESKRPIEAK